MARGDSGSTSALRIVVAGDRGTGKSSLIFTAAAGRDFPTDVQRVLPPTTLQLLPVRVPLIVIDTSASVEDRDRLFEELKRADAVVLTYACDTPSTLDRLCTFYLPRLQVSKVRVPIIVVGCKVDLVDGCKKDILKKLMSPVKQKFQDIKACFECSTQNPIQVQEVFVGAQTAALSRASSNMSPIAGTPDKLIEEDEVKVPVAKESSDMDKAPADMEPPKKKIKKSKEFEMASQERVLEEEEFIRTGRSLLKLYPPPSSSAPAQGGEQQPNAPAAMETENPDAPAAMETEKPQADA